MATEIKLPALGENVDSGTVVKILVSAGDTVTEDQAVLELETEKASVDVPASASGMVKEIRVKEGETIKVGQVILSLEQGAETKEVKEKAQMPEKTPEEVEGQKARPEEKHEEAISEKAETREEKKTEAPPPKPLAEKNLNRNKSKRSKKLHRAKRKLYRLKQKNVNWWPNRNGELRQPRPPCGE